MPPFSLDKFFDPAYLFDPNPGAPSDWYAIFAIVFGLIVVAAQGIYLYWAKPRLARDPFRLRLVRIVATIAGSVASVAILFIIARYLTIPYLSMRFLLLLTVLIGIGLIGYFVYYMVQVYPRKVALVEREAIRQRYLPQQRPRQLPVQARRRRKGKKKK